MSENMTQLLAKLAAVTERAERAEAELKSAREQEPVMKYMGRRLTPKDTLESWGIDCNGSVKLETGTLLYARPIPAPAPSVPEEWRVKLLAEFPLFDDEGLCQEKHRCEWSLQQDRKRLHALLQSANHSDQAVEKVAPDCRVCANRGRINGLSQESYCDSCIYHGRDWRQNHFVDARKMADAWKRRCEACAILPCSCK